MQFMRDKRSKCLVNGRTNVPHKAQLILVFTEHIGHSRCLLCQG